MWTELPQQDVRHRRCVGPQDARRAGRWNGRTSTLVPLVVLVIVTPACGTIHASGLRFTGNDLADSARRWEETAPARARETIQRLKSDRTVLVHVIRGKVERGKSRGTAAYRASNPLAKQQCILHPPSDGIEPERDWDVIPDEGHVTIWWLGFGHMSASTDLLFSPGEEWARRAGDAGAESYPLTRRKEQGLERARLAFESLLCTDPEVIAGGGVCTQYGREKVPLVAEMTCKVVPGGR